MKRIIVGAFMLFVLQCANTLFGQCGLTGSGVGDPGNPAQCGVPIRYFIPDNCGCNPSWDAFLSDNGMNAFSFDNSTTIPAGGIAFSFPSLGLSGTLLTIYHNSSGLKYFDIEWDCRPCPDGRTNFVVQAEIAPCVEAMEALYVSCIPIIINDPDSCNVSVSEFTCLKFENTGTYSSCCACTRIIFEDGTVVWDIIGANTNNDATLCYEKPIQSYIVTNYPCSAWCGGTPPPGGGNGTGKTNFTPQTPKTGLQISPNPSPNGFTNAQYNSSIEGDLIYEIADMNGRVISSGRVTANLGNNSWEIGCANCNSRQPYNFILLTKDFQILESKLLLLNF